MAQVAAHLAVIQADPGFNIRKAEFFHLKSFNEEMIEVQEQERQQLDRGGGPGGRAIAFCSSRFEF